VYKTDCAFRMNVVEEIFEIRSCIEILVNDIKVDTLCVVVQFGCHRQLYDFY